MKKIYKKITKVIPPLCACNCGQQVKRSKITGKWNKYIQGHNSRSSSNNARFKPGNKCGKGRPEGSKNKVTIAAQNLLKGEEEALTRTAIDSALNGNVQMLQFCLSRLLPPPPKDELIKLDDMPECVDMASAKKLTSYLLKQVANGKLTPNHASLLSGIITKHIECMKLTVLEENLAKIEEKLEQQKRF